MPLRPPQRGPGEYLRAIGTAKRLESGAGAVGPEAAARQTAEELTDEGRRAAYVQRLKRAFARADRGLGAADAATAALRNEVTQGAADALAKLATARTDAQLELRDRMGLEAVVLLTGRPSLEIKDGDLDIDLTDPDVAEWQGVLALARSRMKKTIASVGRIDTSGSHVGTGFVVAPGVVMTNRHVLEALAEEKRKRNGTRTWTFGGAPTIDFLEEFDTTAEKRFTLRKVLFSGPVKIGNQSQVRKLDIALLEVDRTNEAGDALPAPLKLAKSSELAQAKSEVYMVGYPARPSQLPLTGGSDDQQLIDALDRVFRFRYGGKRLAIGTITHTLGTVPSDTRHWAIGHDATTLGGNSGSCVVALNGDNTVLGIHFGGRYFAYNSAHVLSAVSDLTAADIAALGMIWR